MKRHLVAIAKYYGMSEERIKSINYDDLEAKFNEDFKSAHNFYMNINVGKRLQTVASNRLIIS